MATLPCLLFLLLDSRLRFPEIYNITVNIRVNHYIISSVTHSVLNGDMCHGDLNVSIIQRYY